MLTHSRLKIASVEPNRDLIEFFWRHRWIRQEHEAKRIVACGAEALYKHAAIRQRQFRIDSCALDFIGRRAVSEEGKLTTGS